MVFQQPDEHRSSTTSASKARKRKTDVTEARSRAQRTKLETQAKASQHQRASEAAKEETSQSALQARRRAAMTLSRAIDDYLQDHEGGNHSKKTLEWHHTALGLLQTFLKEERDITLVGEVEATDISAWFAHMRKVDGSMASPDPNAPSRPMPVRCAPSFTGWCAARSSNATHSIGSCSPRSADRSSRPSNPRNSNSCCWPARRPTRRGRWPIAQPCATGPSSGCSTTPAFAFPSYAGCGSATSTAGKE